MQERILITGGAGFIGINLTKKLISKGHLVTILDDLSPQIHGNFPVASQIIFDKKVKFVKGSVTDRECVKSALKDVVYVFHLAAETGTGQSMYQISKYIDVNCNGTAILLEEISLVRSQVKKLILASSRSIYGEGAYSCGKCNSGRRIFPQSRNPKNLEMQKWEHYCNLCNNSLLPLPTSEKDKINPISIYASTKHNQEQIFQIYCASFGIDLNILRFQNVYGNGQSLKNPYTGIISIFSTRIRHKKNILIFEDGKETRDFIHINDVVDSLVICLNNLPTKYKIMNIGSGEATSVLKVAEILIKEFKSSSKVEINSQYRFGDIRHNFADNSLIKELIPNFPSVGIYKGLRMFCKWVKIQPMNEDYSSFANKEMKSKGLLKD